MMEARIIISIVLIVFIIATGTWLNIRKKNSK